MVPPGLHKLFNPTRAVRAIEMRQPADLRNYFLSNMKHSLRIFKCFFFFPPDKPYISQECSLSWEITRCSKGEQSVPPGDPGTGCKTCRLRHHSSPVLYIQAQSRTQRATKMGNGLEGKVCEEQLRPLSLLGPEQRGRENHRIIE